MQDINLIHPLTAAIAAGATAAVVDDIETAIAWLDTHGGTQSLTRTGDTIAGVFLGIEFFIRLINKTNKTIKTTQAMNDYIIWSTTRKISKAKSNAVNKAVKAIDASVDFLSASGRHWLSRNNDGSNAANWRREINSRCVAAAEKLIAK